MIDPTEEARLELAKYSGYPCCQDCKWKLGTEITNNCICMFGPGGRTPEQAARYEAAFDRARELQAIIGNSHG
jgi:hypothetical protein